jgi:hypothetical protein
MKDKMKVTMTRDNLILEMDDDHTPYVWSKLAEIALEMGEPELAAKCREATEQEDRNQG